MTDGLRPILDNLLLPNGINRLQEKVFPGQTRPWSCIRLSFLLPVCLLDSSVNSMSALLQVLELTQGQEVELESLAVKYMWSSFSFSFPSYSSSVSCSLTHEESE